jgi:hypothetical protein
MLLVTISSGESSLCRSRVGGVTGTAGLGAGGREAGWISAGVGADAVVAASAGLFDLRDSQD